ncbi:hypothetical protein DPMN_041337 [Dreissena polymorpha]|uniref:Uncharacterized protein n=1 Tax=Dreissena polymorpha TaxID=45954 RepID=A0A9D4CZ56_DREPO|nr:hypothetical protein DPMN_041337 [Dreissena polymorpha]
MAETALKNIPVAVYRENAQIVHIVTRKIVQRAGLHGTIFLLKKAYTASLQAKWHRKHNSISY